MRQYKTGAIWHQYVSLTDACSQASHCLALVVTEIIAMPILPSLLLPVKLSLWQPPALPLTKRLAVDLLSKCPVVRSFGMFSATSRKLLNKQLICRFFETPWCWCDVTVIMCPSFPPFKKVVPTLVLSMPKYNSSTACYWFFITSPIWMMPSTAVGQHDTATPLLIPLIDKLPKCHISTSAWLQPLLRIKQQNFAILHANDIANFLYIVSSESFIWIQLTLNQQWVR